jgi:hypothetical protein
MVQRALLNTLNALDLATNFSCFMLSEEQKTLLGPNTLSFAQLEYYLKLCLKSSTARIVSCYVLSNPHLTEQFTRTTHDLLVLQSLVDSSDLVGGNTEEDVIRRGFQVLGSQKGIKFSVGQFQPKSTFLLIRC